VCLRYFNVFGPRQDPQSEYAAVIPKFITVALAGKQPRIFGDGSQSRDFCYIDNVIEANFKAASVDARQVSGGRKLAPSSRGDSKASTGENPLVARLEGFFAFIASLVVGGEARVSSARRAPAPRGGAIPASRAGRDGEAPGSADRGTQQKTVATTATSPTAPS